MPQLPLLGPDTAFVVLLTAVVKQLNYRNLSSHIDMHTYIPLRQHAS